MRKEDIQKLIKQDRTSSRKKKAREGVAYYKGEHDILGYKLMFFDGNGKLREDKFSSNIKIQHQFHTELVDQKVQYLLSNPVEIAAEDEQLQEHLEEYINEDFQEVLQDVVEGASNKGEEYIYCYINEEDKLDFQAADSLGIIRVYDNTGFNLEAIIRYYDIKDNDNETVTKIELWDRESTTYYIGKGDKIELDRSVKVNPQPHIILTDGEESYDGGGLGYIPFFKLDNNKYKKTDLEPIKSLIDDYDLMNASLSNNLEDFQDAIYVVRGYPGDSLDELKMNLKTRKTVGVDDDGMLDVKTIDIPYEARKVKLELDKENIYKFGMGFDSSQVGDGNITNVVIKSRYALLDLKCNKAETRLRNLLRDILKVIIQDINRRHGTSFTDEEVSIDITRQTMVNEDSIYENEKKEAETKATMINVLLSSSSRLSEETITRKICELLDIDYEEESEKLEIEGKQDTAIDIDRLSELIEEDDEDEEVL